MTVVANPIVNNDNHLVLERINLDPPLLLMGTFGESILFLRSVRDNSLVQYSLLNQEFRDVELPHTCTEQYLRNARINDDWIAMDISCTTQVAESHKRAVLINQNTHEIVNLSDVFPNTFETFFGQLGEEYATYTVNYFDGSRGWYLYEFSSGESIEFEWRSSQPSSNGSAGLSEPWVTWLVHSSTSTELWAMNTDTREKQQIASSPYGFNARVNASVLGWTELGSQDIYAYDFRKGEYYLIVDSDGQRYVRIKSIDERGRIFYIAQPEGETEQGFAKQLWMNDFHLGHEVMLYENLSAEYINGGQTGDGFVVWRERHNPSPGDYIERVYYRNVSKLTVFMPLIQD